VLLVFCLLIVTAPCLAAKPDKPPGKPPKPGDDEIAPGAVTDLGASNPTHHTVDLTWTATADDGYDPASGPATSYDIRYVDGTLNDSSWDTASQARGEPLPGEPDTTETFTLKALLPDTTYEIGIKVLDEAGNVSALSNVVVVTTELGGWDIQVVDGTAGGTVPNLAFAPDGYPSIVYKQGIGIYFAHYNGTSWDLEAINETDAAVGPDIEYDPDTDQATVSYGCGALKFYKRLGPGSWELERVESKAYNEQTSLAYDHYGDPTIVYRSASKGKAWMKYASWNGTDWDKDTVGEPGEGRHKEQAFDLNGNPGIAFSGGGALKYAHWNGTDWDIEIVESATNYDCSLVYDPATGHPSITHKGPRGERIRYLWFDGADWNLEIVADTGGGPQLRVGPDGTHTIGYIKYLDDPQGNELWIARRINGVWEKSLITSGFTSSQYKVGFSFSPDGLPAMSFPGFDGIRYAQQRPPQP